MKKTLVSLLLLAGFCVSAEDTVIVDLHGTSEIGKEAFNGYNTQLAGGNYAVSESGHTLVLGADTTLDLDAEAAQNGISYLLAAFGDLWKHPA